MTEGVNYFPLDCTLDEKFDYIEAELGMQGFAIVVKLFQRIYGGHGYYCEWNERISLLFAHKIGADVSVVRKIVSTALQEGIFDKAMYESQGILTSHGIQKRFYAIAKRRQVIFDKPEYMLFSMDDVCSENENACNGDENVCNQNTSKVKESKRSKGSKGEEGEETAGAAVSCLPASGSRFAVDSQADAGGSLAADKPTTTKPTVTDSRVNVEGLFASGNRAAVGESPTTKPTVTDSRVNIEGLFALGNRAAVGESSAADKPATTKPTTADSRVNAENPPAADNYSAAGGRPADQQTDQPNINDLSERFGEDNVRDYIAKNRQWREAHGLKGANLRQVRQWLEIDGVEKPKPQNHKRFYGSFDMDAYMERVRRQYTDDA